MIFSADMATAVKDGAKTMTRRPVRGELRCPECRTVGVGPICMDCGVRSKPLEACRYKAGKDYAVQPGRGVEQTCRILVDSVHAEPLGAITHDDAKAEGFKTGVIGFARKWLELHDRAWLEALEVSARRTPEGQAVEDLDRLALDRFEGKHARRMVWVIAFHRAAFDTPRLLATTAPVDLKRARKHIEQREHSQHIESTDADLGYTATPARALPDEPEAVDAETQKRITQQAGTTHAQWRTIERARRDADLERLSIGRRLDVAIMEAQAAGRSTTREVRVIEQRLRALEQAGRALRAA